MVGAAASHSAEQSPITDDEAHLPPSRTLPQLQLRPRKKAKQGLLSHAVRRRHSPSMHHLKAVQAQTAVAAPVVDVDGEAEVVAAHVTAVVSHR